METLSLQWFLILGSILCGTLWLPGIITSINEAVKHIFGHADDGFLGYSQQQGIGLFPALLFSTGMCSMTYGLLWSTLVSSQTGRPGTLFYGVLIGGMIGVLHLAIVKRVGQHGGGTTNDILSDWLLNSIAGGISGGISGLVGAFGISMSVLYPEGRGDVVIAHGYSLAVFLGIAGIFVGGVVGILIAISMRMLLPLEQKIRRASVPLLSSLFGWLNYNTILCHSCFRLSHPLKSRYDTGRRYCEHCHTRIPRTAEPGILVITFGNVVCKRTRRVFLLSNPSMEQQERSIDVSHVYIDTVTCHIGLLEQFITYIVNYPPTQGLHTVQIFYTGTLDQLGKHLKNVLHNTFTHIERIQSVDRIWKTKKYL